MAASHDTHRRKRRLPNLRAALAPIYLLALVNAIVCWTLTWVFWERYEFSASLFGLGCFPIVVAVCAYLYLLTKRVERDNPE